MLAKKKLNTIEILFSKALIDSYVSNDKFILINMCSEHKYNGMKEERKILWKILYKKWKGIVSVVRKMYQAKILVLEELSKID